MGGHAITGSVGAGFSIKHGVTTRARVEPRGDGEPYFRITTDTYKSENTDVSKFVLDEFAGMGDYSDKLFDVRHEITVPVGYGLGSSGAVALSTAYALDRALGTGLEQTKIGEIAHNAEIACKTGLGDVLASFHGGFEIRLRPGAPGTGVGSKDTGRRRQNSHDMLFAHLNPRVYQGTAPEDQRDWWNNGGQAASITGFWRLSGHVP